MHIYLYLLNYQNYHFAIDIPLKTKQTPDIFNSTRRKDFTKINKMTVKNLELINKNQQKSTPKYKPLDLTENYDLTNRKK